MAKAADGVAAREVARQGRIRLLSTELDQIRQRAVDRTRSIDSKASFVVVAAGFLAGATFNGLVSAASAYLGLLPLLLTTASVTSAIYALWPTKVWTASARKMVDEWVDHHETSPDALEDQILEVKAKEATERDNYNEKRATAVRLALILLVIGLFLSLVVVAMNAVAAGGSQNVGVGGHNPRHHLPGLAPHSTP